MTIKEQAIADQQAGIGATKGRDRYTALAERSEYMNMWLESMRVNGPSKTFVR